jgi:hypothetical protein
MGIGGLRGGKMGIDGKMHYNPGWEPGSMKTLVNLDTFQATFFNSAIF